MYELLVRIGSHPLFPAESVLVATLIGGFITWFFAWWYYERSGSELRREADALHKSTSLVLAYLESRHADVKVQRDDKGHVTGIIVGVAAHGVAATVGVGTLTGVAAPSSRAGLPPVAPD
jgi:hypothetical protein